MHPVVQVKVYDENTKTYTHLHYNITRQSDDVTVVPSIVESYYGIKHQTYQTIKVTDELYVTSHNFITQIQKNNVYQKELKLDLELKSLPNDVNNKYYCRENGEPLKNLTSENELLLLKVIQKELINRDVNEVPKADITSHLYIEESLLSYKMF